MTITCGIQSTGDVTIAMKMLHNICNMCTHDLPDNIVLGKIQHEKISSDATYDEN